MQMCVRSIVCHAGVVLMCAIDLHGATQDPNLIGPLPPMRCAAGANRHRLSRVADGEIDGGVDGSAGKNERGK